MDFNEIWCCDFEFRLDGGKPVPVCMVAQECYSQKEIVLFGDFTDQVPFNIDENTLFVSYMSAAELTCFIALGWQLPAYVLDLAQEYKMSINVGASDHKPWKLVDALLHHGLTHLMAEEKVEMVQLILSKTQYSDKEKNDIIEYCREDVRCLKPLFEAMFGNIDFERAIGFRGRYMKAVARMEMQGVPFDNEMYNKIRKYLPLTKQLLIQHGDRVTQSYSPSGKFEMKKFESFIARENLTWARTDTGKPKTDNDYIKTRANGAPHLLRDFHELRGTLALLRGIEKTKIDTDSDGRNKCLAPSSDGLLRCPLWAFGAATGRNQPPASQFIFGPATWLRGLIKPFEGMALAYIDWSQQEIAIAAGLSGDENMLKAYASGDVYLALAKLANLVPENAVNDGTYDEIRNACKIVALGMSYGKGWRSIAADANLDQKMAKFLWEQNHKVYSKFWEWIDRVQITAKNRGYIETRFGWRQIVTRDSNERALLNFHMQAHGAHMMQIAAIAATEQGLHVCCPVHDAFLISSTIYSIEKDVETMQEIMSKAARLVAKVDIRSEAKVIRFPDRYSDKRGESMWNKIVSLIAEQENNILELEK